MQLRIDGKDVTKYAQSVTWSGDLQSASRTLSVKLERGCRPELGDKVSWAYDGKTLFSGIVMYVDLDEHNVGIECNDMGIYLANNYPYKEYKGQPQEIAKKVCAEFGVGVGKLAEKKASTKVTCTGSTSAFKVIEQAYEGDRKRAKQYVYRVTNGRLHIEKAGASVAGTLQVDIISAKRSHSIKSMVNLVVILNDKNKRTGSVELKAERRKYGTFQKTCKKEKGKKEAAAAKELLQGIEKKGSLTALGNPKFIAGKGVYVQESRTGFKSRNKQIIKSDKHTWTSADYTMNLEFYYA